MKILCFKYGEALYPENPLFADRTENNKIPLSFCFYLIETKDKKILVDTGCEAFEHYNMYVSKRPIDLLKEYGLSPDDVTDVVITHSHLDHIEGVSAFKNSQIHIQKYEFERAGEYITSEFNCNVFEKSTEVCKDVTVQLIGGHTKGSSVVFAGDYLLCGDEAYSPRNFTDKVRIGNCYSTDAAQNFVEKYADGKYKTLVFHDPEFLPNSVGFKEIN